MSKNRTIGKQRLDKYYNLAKEKGYRARSAFKLLQINKKYGFLNNAKILIDLCAAPGGWLQVAAQEMPRPRKIIGIDLDPIKYIGDAETFVCDITTDECRKRLYGMLSDEETRQADVILHDGAPNVGTSWESDAFNQNVLVFYSLQLTSLFLKEGGTFVTKIFRSNDYDALINVLNKMFRKVEATKPLSSRIQSAEIFVVCLDYRGIKNFDENLLTYENVFTNNEDNFDEYKYTKIKFSEYIRSSDPEILSKITEIENDLPIDLDVEFKYLIKDIKILSKNDLNKIIKKKQQIIKEIKKGKILVPALDFLRIQESDTEEEEFQMVTLSLDEKIKEIDSELKNNRKNIAKQELCETESSNTAKKITKQDLCEIDNFYDDDIFCNMNLNEEEYDVVVAKEVEEEKIEVESCSDSLDVNEEEIQCISRYKDYPTEFIESTVDRYWVDPDEELPQSLKEDQNNFGRPSKSDESKLTKKEKEALMRRKTRAERRAEKYMTNMIIEESDEERHVAKEVYRKEFKKTKNKSRIVFPKKGNCGIPRGKGRLVYFDRRLKKDKRRNKSK